MSVVIREKQTDAVLAEGKQVGQDVLPYEGNLYFDPGAIVPGVLQRTERTSTCPYKGISVWVDFHGPDGTTVRDVAWVYDEPKPGHEAIRGRFGFHAGDRGRTRQDG